MCETVVIGGTEYAPIPKSVVIDGREYVPRPVAETKPGQGYVVRPVEELPPLISTAKAAEILDCTDRYVRGMCERQVIKAIRCGEKSWKVNAQSLLEYAGLAE